MPRTVAVSVLVGENAAERGLMLEGGAVSFFDGDC